MPDDVLITSASEISWRADSARKKIVLTSSSAISQPMAPPLPAPPAPAPDPTPEPVQGYGAQSADVRVDPSVLPLDGDALDAGWILDPFTGELTTNPGGVQSGPDHTLPLDIPAVQWSADAQSLTIEAKLQFLDPTSSGMKPDHDYWIGLQSEDGQNAVLLGIFGTRALGVDPAALVGYVKLGGVVLIALDLFQIMTLPAHGEFVWARLELYPVGGGLLDRRAVGFRYRDPIAGWSSNSNEFNSMDPLDSAQWGAISALLQNSDLRPVVKIGARAGGPGGGSSWAFHKVRFC